MGVPAVKQSGLPEVWVASNVYTEYELDKDILTASNENIHYTWIDSESWPWPEVSNVTVEPLDDRSQPAVELFFSRITITIKPEYADQIDAVNVNVKGAGNTAAVEQSGTPGTWVANEVVSTTRLASAADLAVGDIIITRKGGGGSREEMDISGSWQTPPIVKVTKKDASQPAVELFNETEVRVYTNPGTGTLSTVRVNNNATTHQGKDSQGNDIWKATLADTPFDSVTAGTLNIWTDYAAAPAPGAAEIIERVQISYDGNSPGYLIYIDVDRSESGNVANGSMEVIDSATGEVLASLANGKLTQSFTKPRQFGGVLEDPGSDSLAGKTVTVKVTTATKVDERPGVYGQIINY
jgi:hypothetical protein